MPTSFETDPVLVEVVRNGVVESVHHGRVAVTGPDGALLTSLGAEFAPMYPRSAVKPLQAVGLLRAGLDLDAELLAVVCASHSGEALHTEAVLDILTRSGLSVSALQTPPDWPLDEQEREQTIRRGGTRTSVAMNCSGKHAGMLRTTALAGGDVAGYLDPDQPVQLAVASAISDLAHEQAGQLAVDGCGAPLYAISLYGLARAFGHLATSTDGAEHRVATAIREHPEYVSGTRRDERDLHSAVPGLIGKAGAEAVYAVGLPDGRGVAVKIGDGGTRARAVAMAGVLQRLGLDGDVIAAQASAPVLGHGVRVGEVRPSAAAIDRL